MRHCERNNKLIIDLVKRIFECNNRYQLNMSHTENLTIMFTDIADYSESVAKMSRKQSEEMLKAHDTVLRKIIKKKHLPHLVRINSGYTILDPVLLKITHNWPRKLS